MTLILAIGYLLMVVAFAGWAVFRLEYKPLRPRGHSRVGRHLIRTADSMLALLGVSLLLSIMPLPVPVMGAITIAVLLWLAWVPWERVFLARTERKARAEPATTEEDDE